MKQNPSNLKPGGGLVLGQPFDPQVSANYRIPGLVYHNGMLVASADVRWDQEKDGGGLDLVVSRSADGTAWNYTIPGYLGDNGNAWNPDSSTLMDPLIISDGKRLYLLADLFPAGYSLGATSTTHVFEDTGPAFDGAHRLLLSDDGGETYGFRLEDGEIVNSSGENTGWKVRDWFDLYDKKGNYVSNLFFVDSPYKTRPAGFICMSVSDDDGRTWSAPTLLDLKDEGTAWLVVGPGSGLVTRDGKLAFTAYDGENIYLVYGNGASWKKVKTGEAANESSVIELRDGTIRAFVKRGGSNHVAYVDFTKQGSDYIPGKLVDTGDENFSHCMVSSLYYSKTYGGREVVLVCCPSDASGGLWAGRFRGKIYAYALDENNDMILLGTHRLNTGFFAYSNMAQLPDGTVGILYEDDCISYAAGNHFGKASHISYVNINVEDAFGIIFDE